MKTCSVIIPVYNEKSGIRDFLESLYQQSRKPDEIIVVDGNSTDGTLDVLKDEEKRGKIRLFSFPCNIAKARNYAIEHAKHDIILCTDAGCKVDRYRCEEIMKIYEHTTYKVIGGKSEYLIKSHFQKLVVQRIISPDPNFSSGAGLKHFVSSRNISFYKSARKEVGGYPEELTRWGEDTYFNYKIEQAGYTIHYCPSAIVHRGMGSSYKDFYKMYRNYTQGDVEVWMIHKVVQSGSIREAAKYFLFFLFVLFLLFYLPKLILPILILVCLVIGFYKRSAGGFWFDLRFSLAKIAGMVVGLRKGTWTGIKIRSNINK